MQERGLVATIDPPNTAETVVICKLDEMLESNAFIELWLQTSLITAASLIISTSVLRSLKPWLPILKGVSTFSL